RGRRTAGVALSCYASVAATAGVAGTSTPLRQGVADVRELLGGASSGRPLGRGARFDYAGGTACRRCTNVRARIVEGNHALVWGGTVVWTASHTVSRIIASRADVSRMRAASARRCAARAGALNLYGSFSTLSCQ